VAELEDGGERTGRALSLTSDYHVPVDGSIAPDLDSVLPYWYERKYRQSLHPLFGSGLVARGKEGCDLIYYIKLHTTCDNHHCLYISC
jgi:hypothetical protein